jgi:hypothetical protein
MNLTAQCPHCGTGNDVTGLFFDLNFPVCAEVYCETCNERFIALFEMTVTVTAREAK